MATIYNCDLSKELQIGAKIQISDKTPSELAEKVVPVMEVNPKLLRRCDTVRQQAATNATSATIFTTPTDRDFYLVGASLSVIKDATATSLASSITVSLNGLAYAVIRIASLTLTAQSEALSISIPYPIKVDRGTTIQVTNTTNVGNITASGTIFGYIDYTSNA